jgi:hypothetical protein
MIGLLQLIAMHGNSQVRAAVETALACGSSDAMTVRHLLRVDMHSEHNVAPLFGSGIGFERPLPKLDIYDQLLSTRSQAEVRA